MAEEGKRIYLFKSAQVRMNRNDLVTAGLVCGKTPKEFRPWSKPVIVSDCGHPPHPGTRAIWHVRHGNLVGNPFKPEVLPAIVREAHLNPVFSGTRHLLPAELD